MKLREKHEGIFLKKNTRNVSLSLCNLKGNRLESVAFHPDNKVLLQVKML